MAYKGKSGFIKELNIFIHVNANGQASFWCDEHNCNAIWQDSLQAFAVRDSSNKWVKVEKQPSILDSDTDETYWGWRDPENPCIIWGAMWWA